MAYTPLMRYLLLAILTLVPCFGCIVAVKDDGSAPPSEPPPPPPPQRVVVVGEAQESLALKYVKDVPLVYEAFQKACARLNIKITDSNKPGSGNNFTASGFHANGSFEFSIYMHRRDHKSTATVTVKSGRFGDQQCREWTRRIHAEIGTQLGEDGRN